MPVRDIHHLGVAVDDLDEAVETYRRLFGAELEHREAVADQGVEAASMKVGGGRVELLAALGPDTPVGRFLAKRGPGMHHVAFEVADIDVAVRDFEASRALVVCRPVVGFEGRRVAFLFPNLQPSMLTELVETRPATDRDAS